MSASTVNTPKIEYLIMSNSTSQKILIQSLIILDRSFDIQSKHAGFKEWMSKKRS